MAELKFIVSMDSSAFKDGAKDVVAQVKQMSGEVKTESSKMQKDFDAAGEGMAASLKKVFGVLGGAAAFKSLVDNVIRVRSEFQKAGVAIETMLGSKEKADDLMRQVKEIAASSPLEFGDITKATQQMISFNIEAEKVPQFIKAIGDVSMGEKDRFQSLALAFSQVSASGKLMGGDLLQMINAGFNPLATMSEKTGKSIGQLKDEMSKGAISAEMVQQAFIDATSAGGKFYGMSENAAKTVGGQISMMQDAISSALNEIGEKNDGIIMTSIKGITELIKNYDKLIEIIGGLVVTYGAYRAALVLLTAAQKAGSIATALQAKWQAILNSAMLANPVYAYAAALAAVVAAIYSLVTAESNYERAIRNANKAIDEQENRLKERQQNIEQLIGEIQDETKTETQRIKAYEQLRTLAPELTKEYSREALAKMESAKAQKILNEITEEADYQETKRQIEQLTKAIEEQKEAMSRPVQGGGMGYGLDMATEQQRRQLEKLQAQLDQWEAKLKNIIAIRKQAADESRPIEIRIKEARENEKVQKDILDFWDEAAKKIQELSNPKMVMTFEGSKANLDEYIGQVEKKVEALRQDMKKRPLDQNLQLKYTEGQKILDILKRMRASWIASGNTKLPITLEAEVSGGLSWILKAFNNAKNKLLQLLESTKESANKGTSSATTTKQKTPKSSNKDDKLQAARDLAKYKELLKEVEVEKARYAKDLELNTAQAEIDAMVEGTDKVLRQLQQDYKAREEEITREYEDLKQKKIDKARELWEAEPKNKDKIFDPTSVDASYTAQETAYFRKLREANKKNYEQSIKQVNDEQRQAMLDYLKEYGSFQQRRLAIAEDYDEKIARAQSEAQRLTLEAEKNKALEAFDLSKFKNDIDWEQVFGNLDEASLRHLEKLRGQLEGLLRDGTMEASEYKTVVEQINKIDEQIVDKKNEWRNALGLTIPTLERQKQLEAEAAKAQALVADLTQQQADATKQVEAARKAIKDYLYEADVEVDLKDVTIANSDKIIAQLKSATETYRSKMSKLDPASDEYKELKALIDANEAEAKQLQDLFADLAGNEIDLTKVTDNLAKAITRADNATDAAGSSITKTLKAIGEITEKVNANIQSGADLLETLGIADTAFGRGFGEFANAAGNLSNAFTDLQRGNYVGAVNGVVAAVGSLGQALGSLGIGGFGDSDKTLIKDIERLTASNEALQDAVESLTEEMQQGAVAEATEVYRQIQDDINKSIENSQEMMRRSAAAYNNGFLGIGGKGSSNAKINEALSATDWEKISRITHSTVRDASDFWQLTSKQMSDVARRAPEIYGRIKDLADDGYKDAAQFMDEYINFWKQLEEAENAYNEKLTSVSLDTITGDFANALADMDSNAADFADNFEKYLKDAIINALVSNEFEPRIKDWYKNFSKAAETEGIDAAEQDALRREWDAITKLGLERREQLRQLYGWGSTGDESGVYGAVKSFSQEQGDELNGRLTAIQIGQQRSNESLLAAVTSLQNLSVVINAGSGTLNEMRNLMLIGNGHLEDIARYTRATSQNSVLLQDIANKVKSL